MNTSEISLKNDNSFCNSLVEKLTSADSLEEKLELLDQLTIVQNAIQKSAPLRTFLAGLSPECEYAIKSILAIGQGPVVFNIPDVLEDKFERLRVLLQSLLKIETFYSSIGGIVGYHATILNLIQESHKGPKQSPSQESHFYQPEGVDLSQQDTDIVRQAIIDGITTLPQIAELYPLGGAGDRLGLTDEQTGEPLPAAMLLFGGRTLLEGLIRDLQAREYLHYKLFGKQLATPIALMTSLEKHNHSRITTLLETNNWYGRDKDSFRLFTQSSVPVINEEGNWSMLAPLTLNLKPGGHGSIWKFAKDNLIFEWLQLHKRKKTLVRQINNPVAGTDHTLLAFTGIGCSEDMDFGFASCHRTVGAAEGVNVIKETKTGKGYEYTISNIEYTDFAKLNIEDSPVTPGSTYSRFPSNTNILFADLKTLEKTAEEHPIPGMLINMKNTAPYIAPDGKVSEIKAGRLESTMQNISDYISDAYPTPLPEGKRKLQKIFLTFNERCKTISCTKRSYSPNSPPLETPEGCHTDVMKNIHDLLTNFCKITAPTSYDSPDYTCFLHPALGPLYSVIGQKIRGGRLTSGSELQLEIAELDIERLFLDGSLLIKSQDVLGKKNKDMLIEYGEESGKCTLDNVRIINEGIESQAKNTYWRNDISRHEALQIILHGNAEFHASDVTFNGSHIFEVKNGERLVVSEKDGDLQIKREKLILPSWHWKYTISSEKTILLKKHTEHS
ncbi:MAG: hypothetical protein ACI9S8_002042 [Chlamydiales bacterium]|jgi:hypothetical protein